MVKRVVKFITDCIPSRTRWLLGRPSMLQQNRLVLLYSPAEFLLRLPTVVVTQTKRLKNPSVTLLQMGPLKVSLRVMASRPRVHTVT